MDQEGAVWLEEGSQVEEIKNRGSSYTEIIDGKPSNLKKKSTNIFHASGTLVCLKRNHLLFI